jgi:hypothetical protein
LRRDGTCRLGVVRFVGLEKAGPPRGVRATERPPGFSARTGSCRPRSRCRCRSPESRRHRRSFERSQRQDHHRADKGREVGARTESIHAAADLTFAADPSSYSQTTSPADGSTAPMAKERSEPHHGLDHRLLLRKRLQRPSRSLRDLRQHTRTQRFKRRGRRQLPPARGSRRWPPHRSDTRRWLQRAVDPHRVATTDGAAPAGGHPNRQSLTDGRRLLPAPGVEVGAAQGAAGRVWRDALAALRAVARVHVSKDAVHGCEDAKQSVRSG